MVAPLVGCPKPALCSSFDQHASASAGREAVHPCSPPHHPAPVCRSSLPRRQAAWRRVVQLAVGAGIAVPGITSSLAYFDTYRRGRLPANLVQVGEESSKLRRGVGRGGCVVRFQPSLVKGQLVLWQAQHSSLHSLRRHLTPALLSLPCPSLLLQAQRDFFGSHTYERTDGKEGWFHTVWDPTFG